MLNVLTPTQFALQTSQDTAPPVQQSAIEESAERLAYQSTMGGLSVARIEASAERPNVVGDFRKSK